MCYKHDVFTICPISKHYSDFSLVEAGNRKNTSSSYEAEVSNLGDLEQTNIKFS